MTDLLVTVILAMCPASNNGGTTECMERVTNCAVEMETLVTFESISKCMVDSNMQVTETKQEVKYQPGLMKYAEDEAILKAIAGE